MTSGKRNRDWTMREFSKQTRAPATKAVVFEKSSLRQRAYMIMGRSRPAIVGNTRKVTRLIGRELPIDDQSTMY